MNERPKTYKLDKWEKIDKLRQTLQASCVYLTVRWLVQYGLLLEGKALQGACVDIQLFEPKHQCGGYFEAIQHFTKHDNSKDECNGCYQELLEGSLETSVLSPFSEAKARILEQLQNELPVVFTIQNQPPNPHFHSYAVIEVSNDGLIFISPGNPPTIETKEWNWLEAQWGRETSGGKDLAWYVPPKSE